MIEINSNVKILLRNNTIIEGKVLLWDNIVKLQDKDNSILILPNPTQDIIMIKVIFENSQPTNKPQIPKIEIKEIPKHLDKHLKDEYNKPTEEPLRLKKLAQLKTDLLKQEKAIIANKLKDHVPGQISPPNYQNPFIK